MLNYCWYIFLPRKVGVVIKFLNLWNVIKYNMFAWHSRHLMSPKYCKLQLMIDCNRESTLQIILFDRKVLSFLLQWTFPAYEEISPEQYNEVFFLYKILLQSWHTIQPARRALTIWAFAFDYLLSIIPYLTQNYHSGMKCKLKDIALTKFLLDKHSNTNIDDLRSLLTFFLHSIFCGDLLLDCLP